MKFGVLPRDLSSWCVLQGSFWFEYPCRGFFEIYSRFYKTYVLAVDQTFWCDLDIFGWIRSARCWYDLISHPPNFIFTAFHIFGEFQKFIFWIFYNLWVFGISSKTNYNEWILESLEIISRFFTFERFEMFIAKNKQINVR